MKRRILALLGAAIMAAACTSPADSVQPETGMGQSPAVNDQSPAVIDQPFAPGFGLADPQELLFALPRPVVVSRDAAWVVIKGVTVTREGGALMIWSTGLPLHGGDQVSLADAQGRAIRTKVLSVGSSGLGHTTATYRIEGASPERRPVTVMIKTAEDVWRIPVSPVAPAELPRGDSVLGTNRVGAVTIGGRVYAHPGGTHVSLVVQGLKPGTRLADLGASQPNLELRAGTWSPKVVHSHIPVGSAYIDADTVAMTEAANTVRVRIPRLAVVEPGEAEVELASATAAVDRDVQVGRWQIRITRTERSGGYLLVHFEPLRQEDGLLVGLAGMVSPAPNPAVGVGLLGVDDTIRTLRLRVPSGVERVKVVLTEPTVALKGDWVLNVPVERLTP